MAGLRFQASASDACLFFVLRARGGAVGVLTTNSDDFRGSGRECALGVARRFLERRFGALATQDKNIAHAGVGSAEGDDVSVTLAQQVFTDALRPFPAAKELWATRRRPLKMGISDDVYVN